MHLKVDNTYGKDVTPEQYDKTEQLIGLFNDMVLDMLQMEYDYFTSEKHAEEMIRANEYEFTEDGQRA